MKCATCRRPVSSTADHCPHCGARLNAVATREGGALLPQEPKNPALAALMSFMLPGLGQIYVGQVGKGILYMALLLFSPFTFGMTHIALMLYAAIEANALARRRMEGEPISKWGTLWDPTWRPFS